MKILFISFEFPPLNSGGVQRSMKWVKYLPEFGVNPIVLTIKEEDIPKVFNNAKIDNGLMGELSHDLEIIRISCDPTPQIKNKWLQWFFHYFSITEIFKKTWKSNLEKSLPDIINTQKPDAVYLTIPPFAMAALWRKLLKKYDIPLVVDFRDAWSQWCVNVNGSYLHYVLKLYAERKILKKADAIICSSSQISIDLQRVHPMIESDKFNVITNGYDIESLPDLVPIQQNKDKIIIGYVGSFYYSPEYRDNIFKAWWKKPIHRMLNYVPRKEDWLYRSPFYFFKAIDTFFKSHPEWRDKIEIRFSGSTPGWLIEQIEKFGLEQNCKHFGFLNHDEVISFQKSCDALLITSSKVIGGRDYSIAGKTFEYFTIGKPILSFVTDGVQKDLLEKSGLALIIDPDDTPKAKDILLSFFKGDIRLNADPVFLNQFHRRKLAEKLSDVIRTVILKKKTKCAE